MLRVARWKSSPHLHTLRNLVYMGKIDQTAESTLSEPSTLGHKTIPTFPVLLVLNYSSFLILVASW